MAASVTHNKTSTIPDGPDADLVRPSDWNDEHDVSISAADVGAEPAGTVAAHTGDTSAAHAASAVAVTPVGAVAATDVQAAIQELDTEKSGTGHNHSGTYDPAGTVTTHEAASDPHTGYRLESADHSHASTGLQGGTLAASAIVFTPNGSIAATNVQTAIQEVRDEAAGGGAPSTADYLVGTSDGGLSGEIVVGTTPGGELGGTWASPTVDSTHSGSTHSASTDTHIADGTDAHAASAITFTPDGSISATTVQAAIVEVRDEAAGGGAPSTVDYLVGTASGGLSAEIVVGTSPGGELGGTWASPTVDSTHSGSTHTAATTTHEGLSDPHTGYMLESVFGSTAAAVMATLQAQALGLPKIIRASGDSTVTNTTTLASVNGLLFPVAVNEVWFCEVYVIGTNGAAGGTADWKFGWSVPTGCTADWGGLHAGAGTQPGWGLWPAATASVAILAVGATLTIGGTNAIRQGMSFGGIFTADATHAGDVQLQFAQNTQTNENTIIRQLNSFMRLTRLG